MPVSRFKEPSGFFSRLSGRAHPTQRNQDELYHVPPKPVKSGEGAAKKNAVAEHGENGGLEARSPYEGYKAVSLCPPCAPSYENKSQ